MSIKQDEFDANPFIPSKIQFNRSPERAAILKFFADNDINAGYALNEIADGTELDKPTLKKRLATMVRIKYKGGMLDGLVKRATVNGIHYFGLTDKGKAKALNSDQTNETPAPTKKRKK